MLSTFLKMITYEALYEILRKEKYNRELQKLPKDFIKNIISYLEQKQQLLNQDTDFLNIKKQIENIKKIIRDIYECRERKIIELALISSRSKSEIEPSSMLLQEKEMFNNIKKQLDYYREKILFNLISEKKTKKIQNSLRLIRFIKPVPKFLDTNLNTHGPFNTGDLALLPKKITTLLINKKRAEEIKI